jgi:glycosyltransferase involved in cell wall biosynthesis
MALTIVMAVYGQPRMLEFQVKSFYEHAKEVRDQVRVIVVDDHGDPPVPKMINWEVYRIDDDIEWNQMGARNLGMDRASGWCVMIDPDMVFDEPNLRKLIKEAKRNRRGLVTKYCLRHADGGREGEINPTSPNTYLIHRDDFFAAGGYDEEYRGKKGWSDVQMLDVLKAHYPVKLRKDIWADFYGTATIEDAAVMSLDRSVAHNKRLRINKQQQAKRKGWKWWVKNEKGPNLRFKWHQVI